MSQRVAVWPLTIRFFRRVAAYRARILITILIICCAAGAKAGMVYIMKPVVDEWDPLESTCRHASLSIL